MAAAAMSAAPVVLETRGLVKRYGGIVPTDDVSLQVERGARHALIGPNGAGKTTLVNLLSGTLAPSAGSILLDGEDITGLAPHARVRRGVVRTFQIGQLFGSLTPLQSLALSVSRQLGISGAWWRRLGADARVARRATRCCASSASTTCRTSPSPSSPTASGGCSRSPPRSPAGRACCCSTSPSPACPRASGRRSSTSSPPCPEDVSVLLIEHDMDLVFNFARRVTVLVDGSVFADGSPAAIAADPRVAAVYLGEAHGATAHG
jgi:ABC-type branched-subunit amino acid transport system ATPase component